MTRYMKGSGWLIQPPYFAYLLVLKEMWYELFDTQVHSLEPSMDYDWDWLKLGIWPGLNLVMYSEYYLTMHYFL